MAGSRRPRARLSRNGGRAGASTSRWRLSRRWKRVIAVGGGFFAVCVALVAGLVVYGALTLPDINSIGQKTGTIRLVDVHGTVLAEVGHDATNRHNVTIDQIAPILQQATVAAEDRNFYNEGAINPARILKALVDDVILHRPAEGASTITQQLAKQAFFGTDASKSPLRKVREALLANQLDSKYTKQQILEQYLNINYYGENAYGIENASMAYFGKHAKGLTLMEASLLAGLPQAPSYNDPYNNPDAAYARMHYVLGSLVAVGNIKQADADAVDPLVGGSSPTPEQQTAQQTNQQALHADLQNGKPNTAGPAPHFVAYIQDQLQQIFGATDPQYLQGDLVVTTTLDLATENLANTAVAKGVAKLLSSGANNGALLMINAHTGAIEAMVGSASFTNNAIAGQYNIVTASRRPGSSFKPYVYEAGFKNGTLKPDTILQDTRAQSQKYGGVTDFDSRFLGPMTAARALTLSRNVATEQAADKAGIQNVIDLAYGMGISEKLTPQEPNLSTAIGTSAVRMIDHASAYAAFANGGHKVVANGILKITDGAGNVIRDYSTPANLGDVLTSQQAWTITSILRGYAKQWNLHFRYDTAGKSGTTDHFIDAWYMTYTPDWVVATWTGHTSGSNSAEQGMNQVFGTATGAAIAVPFVNSLSKPSAFKPVTGALSDCSQSDSALVSPSGCPTPSPSPSVTATPSSSPTPTASPSPSFTLPAVTPTPTPTPSIAPTPTAAPPAATAARREEVAVAERRRAG
ncbi:MAG: penicillin-binding protein [Candidatus Dormibacteraeota bacterium]|uniref:Penicillin-binding protein n=1 Tax=Candidatus Aeolococcus gillhamiae TaxID=3127015 RepID=A0A934N4Z1_9BACT|nr:penicillin-binding protein [Candidatus Dormibacteraeota bacterium]